MVGFEEGIDPFDVYDGFPEEVALAEFQGEGRVITVRSILEAHRVLALQLVGLGEVDIGVDAANPAVGTVEFLAGVHDADIRTAQHVPFDA